MTTYTALTSLAGHGRAAALGLALERLEPAPVGIGVAEIEDGSARWEVGAYFDRPPDRGGLVLLAALYGAEPFAVSRLDDRDWVAQVRRELSAVEAGRFVVHGGHDRARVPPQKIGLRIEAAMAFGTGHHATTRGCLMMLDRLARTGRRPRCVADLGCGTGVLALAAARLWRATTVAVDIDPVAVATATANARANRAGPWLRIARANGLHGAVARAGAPYDLVLANILAGPLKRMAPDIAGHLRPGGTAILSGLLESQAAGVEAVCRGHGLIPADRIVLQGWSTLALRRLRPRPLQ